MLSASYLLNCAIAGSFFFQDRTYLNKKQKKQIKDMPTSTYITLVIIYTLEAVLIVFGSAFPIFVFWTERSRLKRTYFLLINLAVADLQQHKLYLHDYNYVVTVLQKLQYKKKKTNKQTNKQTNHNNDNAMMTVVNQVSSA